MTLGLFEEIRARLGGILLLHLDGEEFFEALLEEEKEGEERGLVDVAFGS